MAESEMKENASVTKLKARLSLLERVLEPRMMSILTLRPLRFAIAQWFHYKFKSGSTYASDLAELSDMDVGEASDSFNWSSISPTVAANQRNHEDLGIAVFAHTRAQHVYNVLESLARQDAIHCVHVFVDGDQGKPAVRAQIENVLNVVRQYPVREIHEQRGAFGFRKMMLIAGNIMAEKYKNIIFLEDDCFPTKTAIDEFLTALNKIADEKEIFSVYGHPFLVPNEDGEFYRFQGWGWATTREKIIPIWDELRSCYLMSEPDYLAFVDRHLTEAVRKRIDMTPGRQPSDTLTKFFAWDETVCLLTAAKGLRHQRTEKRVIFNCGVGESSTHFKNGDAYRTPPFNMISPSEVWNYFE